MKEQVQQLAVAANSNFRSEQVLLSVKQVVQRVGVCRRTIEREIQRGRFASPLKVGNASRWSIGDVEAYLQLLEKERAANAQDRATTCSFYAEAQRLKHQRERLMSQSRFLAEQKERMAVERKKFEEMNVGHDEQYREHAAFLARAQEIDRRVAAERERRRILGDGVTV